MPKHALLSCTLTLAFACAHAQAKPVAKAPPTTLSRLDRAELDAAMSHLQELQAQLEQFQQRLQDMAKPHADTLARIATTYGFKASDIGKTIDVGALRSTGEIKKIPPKTAAPATPPASK